MLAMSWILYSTVEVFEVATAVNGEISRKGFFFSGYKKEREQDGKRDLNE